MATDTALTVKLLVDRKAERVLFAEASKEVVDFLFSLLALPVATVVKLVGKDAMVGCVGNLYASVENLDSTYVQQGMAKDALLSPAVVSSADGTANFSLLRLSAQPSLSTSQPKAFYKCGRCDRYVTDVFGTFCPSCYIVMKVVMKYASPALGLSDHQKQIVASGGIIGFVLPKAEPKPRNGGATGFVQGIVTYTVMDNLTISPMSSISSITLLSTIDVTHIGHLQEKTVQIGYKEGLAILKASLQSKTVLTDVFLWKNQAAGRA